jgi:DNA-binding response OmpR family regulator
MNASAASGKTILYIEDDVVVLTAYRDRLQKAGFDVESSVDGLEAMRILSDRIFDLIVLDLMLPRFNGVDLLKSIPIVIFSSNLETAQESVLELADKFLLKGNCSFSTLLETIQDLLAAPGAGGATQNN